MLFMEMFTTFSAASIHLVLFLDGERWSCNSLANPTDVSAQGVYFTLSFALEQAICITLAFLLVPLMSAAVNHTNGNAFAFFSGSWTRSRPSYMIFKQSSFDWIRVGIPINLFPFSLVNISAKGASEEDKVSARKAAKRNSKKIRTQ